MNKHLAFATLAAALVAASVAVPSSADARTHYRTYRPFAHTYAYAPGYARVYRYGPRQEWERPFYGRIDSNLNPDRQMVGIND